jgi:hypothetical protein
MARFTDFTNYYSGGKNFRKVIEMQWLLLPWVLCLYIYTPGHVKPTPSNVPSPPSNALMSMA